MPRTATLLKAHAKLTAAIRAGEEWEASYKASPATFKRLLTGEAQLQAKTNEYLIGLSDRVPSIVNWADVKLQPHLKASAVPPVGSDEWKAEMIALSNALSDGILGLMVVGANAGEDIYGVPLGINDLDEFVLEAADKYTAELVSNVTATTRRYIQNTIKKSIAEGDDVAATIARIRSKIANPVRAEMIAQTESVNAYQTGLDRFALESGALSSTWDALSGACRFCAPLDGVTKKIGDYFTLANGKQVQRPPGHVKCRCGRYLNYP